MHVVFRNATDDYDFLSLVEIEHGRHGFEGFTRICSRTYIESIRCITGFGIVSMIQYVLLNPI